MASCGIEEGRANAGETQYWEVGREESNEQPSLREKHTCPLRLGTKKSSGPLTGVSL